MKTVPTVMANLVEKRVWTVWHKERMMDNITFIQK